MHNFEINPKSCIFLSSSNDLSEGHFLGITDGHSLIGSAFTKSSDSPTHYNSKIALLVHYFYLISFLLGEKNTNIRGIIIYNIELIFTSHYFSWSWQMMHNRNLFPNNSMIVFKARKTVMPIVSQKLPEISPWHFIVVRSYLRYLVFIYTL